MVIDHRHHYTMPNIYCCSDYVLPGGEEEANLPRENSENSLKNSSTMRHGYVGRKLNRTWAHRESMFKTMVTQLIKHDAINTTLPKVRLAADTLSTYHHTYRRQRNCASWQTR